MIHKTFIDEITQTIQDLLPSEFFIVNADLNKILKNSLNDKFREWHLISKDEFDVQNKILVSTKAKLEELEKTVSELESSLSKFLPKSND